MAEHLPLLAAIVVFHSAVLALIIGACFACAEPQRRARRPLRRRGA